MSSSSLDFEANISRVTVYAAYVVSSALATLALALSASLRTYLEARRATFSSARDLVASDRADFSSDRAFRVAASCVDKIIGQESVNQ
jgi:hypothetical protein